MAGYPLKQHIPGLAGMVLPMAKRDNPIHETGAAPPTFAVAATKTGGGVERVVKLLYGSENVTFGWRDGIPAKEFSEQLRNAVLHATGLKSLVGAELHLENLPGTQTLPMAAGAPISEDRPHASSVAVGSHVTPRHLFEGSIPNNACLRIVASNSNSIPPAIPGKPVVSSQIVPPKPQKQTGRFQKKGGSHLQFVQMMNANKNPVVQLPKGTKLTIEEVARHKSPTDCWTIFQGRVYDVTMYLDFHPGGKKKLMQGAGKDCTKVYNKIHPWISIDGLLAKVCLGPVVVVPSMRGAEDAIDIEDDDDDDVD